MKTCEREAMLKLVGQKVLYMSVNDDEVQVGRCERLEAPNGFGNPRPVITNKDGEAFYVFGPVVPFYTDKEVEMMREWETEFQWEHMTMISNKFLFKGKNPYDDL